MPGQESSGQFGIVDLTQQQHVLNSELIEIDSQKQQPHGASGAGIAPVESTSPKSRMHRAARDAVGSCADTPDFPATD